MDLRKWGDPISTVSHICAALTLPAITDTVLKSP